MARGEDLTLSILVHVAKQTDIVDFSLRRDYSNMGKKGRQKDQLPLN